jgi:hypothetical protein
VENVKEKMAKKTAGWWERRGRREKKDEEIG